MKQRYNIKLETLSSVHVGSGDGGKVDGVDFLRDDDYVFFLNLEKIGQALKIEDNPKLADGWSKAIIRKQQKQFLQENGVDFKKFSRKVASYAEFSDNNPSVSTQMRDVRGRVYIPGSTIKGAIRTALLAQLAKSKLRNMRFFKKNQVDVWAKEFFGKITHDVLRFIRVGDAFFSRDISTSVIETVLLDKKQNDINNIKQYAEVIDVNQVSQFAIDLDVDAYNFALKEGQVLKDIPELKEIKKLFKLINQHTLSLADSELNIWRNIAIGDSMCVFYEDVVKAEIVNCHENECVIRLGNASGKRFITGGITENFDFCRGEGKNKALPITRRIEIDEEDNHNLLGFVKLSCEE